jgi:thiol:disulfide interchange protein DsbD
LLLWVLEKQSGMNGVLWILTAFVALGFGAWLWLQLKSRSRWTWLLLGVFILPICAAAIYQQQPSGSKVSSTEPSEALLWQVFSKEKLAEARQEGPVFIDFTAAWCVTCQVNKTLVLNREDVQKAFAAAGIRLLRADWTDYNPEITQMLASLGRQGVPVYAFYKDASSSPLLLPEILTADLLLREIGSLTSNATKE